MRNKYLLPIITVSILVNLLLAWQVWAGSPDSPDAPNATSSYTLQDLYSRLTAGTAGGQSVFTEPSSAPGTDTMHSINEIMAVAPALDNINGATTTNVLANQTFWGLTASQWATQTGTMPNIGAITITPDTLTQTIAAGYHNGSGFVEGDADLVEANLKSGVNLFGVDGSLVEASGSATSGQVLNGISFSNSSGASTGTMTNNGAITITPGTLSQTIAAGYHNGSGFVEGDADLVEANLKSGVNLFGVDGSLVEASGSATPGQVLNGISFSNSSGASTGAMTNNGAITITPGTLTQTITAGYHNGSGYVVGDTDLAAGNIRQGTTIFGVTGSLAPGAIAKRVAKTGQTQCWDNSADLTPCAGTGQDGEYQMGIDPVITPTNYSATGAYNTPAWTGVRFIDNGNGTVTDNLTALVWLKNANCWGTQTWANALSNSNGLSSGSCGLSDGSSAGDWRLPNINELHSLIDLTQSNPALPSGHPFSDVLSDNYWSSTTFAVETIGAWIVVLDNGIVGAAYKYSTTYYVWPVRGGQ